MLTGSIIHCHNKLPHFARYPLMGTAVLMQHHAIDRSTLPALAMFALFGRLGNQAFCLQLVFNPCITALTAFSLIPRVEVLHVPSLITVFILLGKCKNLIHGCPSGGRLGQAFVHEAIYSGFLITINVAPKATAANPQQPGGFFLAQPLLCPIPETLFKSHFPDLL